MIEQQNFESNSGISSINFSHKKFAFKYTVIILLIFVVSGVPASLLALHSKWLSSATEGSAQLLFMLLPTLYFAKKSPLPFKRIFRLENTPKTNHIILSIVSLIGLSLFTAGFLVVQESLIPYQLMSAYQNLEKFINSMYEEILGGSSVFDCIRAMTVGAIIPAISEEALFRGLFQRSLEEDLLPVKAMLIAGFIFALIHFNPIGLVPLILIGLYLGFLAYSTQTLIIPIIIHFLNNAFSVLILQLPMLKALDENSYSLTLYEAIPVCFLGILVLLLSAYYINKSSINPLKFRNSSS